MRGSFGSAQNGSDPPNISILIGAASANREQILQDFSASGTHVVLHWCAWLRVFGDLRSTGEGGFEPPRRVSGARGCLVAPLSQPVPLTYSSVTCNMGASLPLAMATHV